MHLALPPEAVERFTTQAGTGEWPLQYGLGAARLRPAFTEVVAIKDLGDMPLSTYLREAHSLKDPAFKAAIPEINALTGHVVILPSQAFDQTTQTLTIQTPLRYIGSYDEATARKSVSRLTSASAQINASPNAPEMTSRSSNFLKIGLLVLAIVALAVGVVVVAG